MTTTATKPLKPHQIAALRALAADPANRATENYVEAGTLSLLRKRGLVGRKVERGVARNAGSQRTISPITPAGRALLASLDGATLPGIGEVST